MSNVDRIKARYRMLRQSLTITASDALRNAKLYCSMTEAEHDAAYRAMLDSWRQREAAEYATKWREFSEEGTL